MGAGKRGLELLLRRIKQGFGQSAWVLDFRMLCLLKGEKHVSLGLQAAIYGSSVYISVLGVRVCRRSEEAVSTGLWYLPVWKDRIPIQHTLNP